ncbi:sulfite exporter TauE/SafE family protein [Aliiglaciecola sp. CAU 1673]|uniref:sulfite exporter TauE/SafE family protein n=1 Tax=Aliiglaciecola sp. CAU 1673 TaxID=3032595 RepID=UPI0023DAE222|nr:sulfite exporter TauE/SafE family protein [Aliiglaciecola sp. CAU 1673]MDF2177456.1 sulfite exporter TauE/SafE family protein [Aliiglaciecola sp. CAU 1673]
MTVDYLWLGLAIWLGFTVQAVAGFGSMVVAVSLSSLMFAIPELLPILIPLNILATGSMAWQCRRDVDWMLLLKGILPSMILGMGAGILLLDELPGKALKTGFALLVLWFALREWIKLYRNLPMNPRPAWWRQLWTLLAGLAQGLYGSGGPLLVYAIGSKGLNKAAFRAVLLCVWFSLNSLYTVVMLFQHKVQPVAGLILLYAPLLYLAIRLGNYLHHRVDERQFKQGVCALLVMSALAMLVS